MAYSVEVVSRKRLYVGLSGLFCLLLFFFGYGAWLFKSLPSLETLKNYDPVLASRVYDRNGQSIGEFFKQKRFVAREFPKKLLKAFVAAEDSQFYHHKGLNFRAIFRALLANLRAGRKAQGASTITQQVARSFLLTREKTYTRKIKEMVLSYQIEQQMTKNHILFLYLNQIYFGRGAYGVATAAQAYFGKSLNELTLAEMAILAGLPQAPSRYSPINSPLKAKRRQRYVLQRMEIDGYITKEERLKAEKEPISLVVMEDQEKNLGFFLETVRQILVKHLGSDVLLKKGIHITTSLDLKKQNTAYKEMVSGLRQLDKRQGYRGPKKNLVDEEAVKNFLDQTRKELHLKASKRKILQPNGNFQQLPEFKEVPNLSPYIKIGDIVPAIVDDVDDRLGLVYVRFAENLGVIHMETMQWARKPDPKKHFQHFKIKNPSQALKKGDIIDAQIVASSFRVNKIKKDLSAFSHVTLEQEPLVEGALLSFDQLTQDVVAMVGGYNFQRSKFNRTYQALRQTGSSFKPIVYVSALDKGFKGNSLLQDIPLVYEDKEDQSENSEDVIKKEDEDEEFEQGIQEKEKWKPTNYSNNFSGEVTLRKALVRSLNVPTVRLISKISVDWVAQYAYRLGIVNPLNQDFTLALGTSGTTLYEMTKVFSHIGRLGKRTYPRIIKEVKDSEGKVLLRNISLDTLIQEKVNEMDNFFESKRNLSLLFSKVKDDPKRAQAFLGSHKKEALFKPYQDRNFSFFKEFLGEKEPPFYFSKKNQLMKPQTAYLMSNLLQGVIRDPKGTGRGARSFQHPASGKTGTSNNFFDAWFLGYTNHYVSGVWVGFDKESSLGVGEGGGRAALPIWLAYMRKAHESLEPTPMRVPEGIVFLNLDGDTGRLPNAQTEFIVSQAFLETDSLPIRLNSDLSSQEHQKTDVVETVEEEIEEDSLKELYKRDLSE